MHRFFVPPEWLGEERVRIEGPVAHQIGHVLRLQPGDRVVLLDGTGKEHVAQLTSFGRDVVEAVVERVVEGRAEPRVPITLYQGLLKGEKLEWVLQKGTELGASAFVPVVCRRSVPQGHRGWQARIERWRRIVTEAAEQCGRSRLPELREPVLFQAACDEASRRGGLALIPWEQEAAVGLAQALAGARAERVSLFIGPEGGFEAEEVAYARERGIVAVCLGRRILRAETAAIAALAALQYHLGEMG